MNSVFDKSVIDLTPEEEQIWEAAYEELAEGNRLYGRDENDLSHIGWSIQQVAARLMDYFKGLSPEQQDETIGVSLIELGISKEGMFISVIPKPEEESLVQEEQ